FLNTGTSADVSFNGETYIGDGKFPSYYGSSATYYNTSAPGGLLYTTERNGKTLNYSIPLPNGTYTVRTHHTELWFGLKGPSATAGRRVFDINIEGSLVKDNFDLFVESSNQPTVLTFEEIEVSDGVLNINMSASLNNSTISGISITGEGEPAEAPVANIGASTLQGLAPLTIDFTGSGSTGGV